MDIILYEPHLQSLWDDFVIQSCNATFLHCRAYMEYHQDRFEDYSLLFFEGKQLIAVLPAHRKEHILYSHQGLTYGGLLVRDEISVVDYLALLPTLMDWLKEQGFQEFLYKVIPCIYHTRPLGEELYMLRVMGAQLYHSQLSLARSIDCARSYATNRRRQIIKSQQQCYAYVETTQLDAFWTILSDNLRQVHGATPVHTLSEISVLQQQFPESIRCFVALDCQEQVQAGVLVYETSQVAHLQYISATTLGKTQGALDGLLDHLIHREFTRKPWFDFGTSSSQRNTDCWGLNLGLIRQKSGFGATGILYETYLLHL